MLIQERFNKWYFKELLGKLIIQKQDYTILEKSKETVLEFYKETAKVL